MISKAVRGVSKINHFSKIYQFSAVKQNILELLNLEDTNNPHDIVGTFQPLLPLEVKIIPINICIGFKPIFRENQRPNYNISKLANGITIVTESQIFPSQIDFGILIDLGTRDETLETSGALFQIKNTFYKTLQNPNQSLGIISMSGGEFNMDYDQENVYWRGTCMQHDFVDMFKLACDCAFEQKSHIEIDQQQIEQPEEFNDLIFRTAFGLKGLGMPIKGIPNNAQNLGISTLQKFQEEHMNPDKIYVCAAGIQNHEEFVELVQSRLSHIPKIQKPLDREISEYIGGETRNQTDSTEVNLALVFQSVEWQSKDVYAYNVINTILGSSASFSTGGPGKGMHARTTINCKIEIYQYILIFHLIHANALNFHFSDTGLFGLQVSGPADHGSKLLNNLIKELKGLTQKIHEQELTRAKNILKSNILMALERQGDRIEEAIKNKLSQKNEQQIKTFNKLTLNDYVQNVDLVTSQQINQIVSKLLKNKPLFVADGGELTKIPSFDTIQNQFRL